MAGFASNPQQAFAHLREGANRDRGAAQASEGRGNDINQDPAEMTSGSRKRQRAETNPRKLYPRRRAAAACQLCRARKTKCDNQRPTCGACSSVGVKCTYQNDLSDFSSFDPATLAIIDRIDHFGNLVETQGRWIENLTATWHDDSPPGIDCAMTPSGNSNPGATRTKPQPPFGSKPTSGQYLAIIDDDGNEDATISVESLELATICHGTSEDILEWPIFEGSHSRASIETLIFDSDSAGADGRTLRSDPTRYPSGAGKGIQEEACLSLINTFLAQVHTKNPILEPKQLQQMAKEMIENGFKWDAESCLVLFACALACLAAPFCMARVTPQTATEAQGATAISSTPEYPTAESYYTAARKRIGLLDHSVITTQCHFLSGVYEMYSLRPIRAWTSFNRACKTLQLCLLNGQSLYQNQLNRIVQRRLFWSCLKSECELRTEIHMPSSGLAKIDYPDSFPTPPTGSPGPTLGVTSEHLNECINSSSQLDFDQEKSWFYYLAEIAVRRILNRLMNVFYKDDERAWLSMPIHRMARIVTELESQLLQWHTYLPTPVASPHGNDEHSNFNFDELTYFLHVRLAEFRERLYRPFFFIAISNPNDIALQTELAPYVKRCLDECARYCSNGSPKHRHHGTWYHTRQLFRMSLILLAAVKSGAVEVPENWRAALDMATAGLKYWEAEAAEVKKARLILQDILHDIDARPMGGYQGAKEGWAPS